MAAFEVIALDPATPQLRAPGPADTYTFPRAVAMSVALPVSSGGTGTSTPSLVAGTNVTITGSWPNQTISASGGGGSSTLTISNKTGAYTVVAGDLGTIINCTSGTFTVSLTAAASLGSGFNCWIWNTGTGVITIDPNGAETIDGRTTIILRPGEGTQIVCNGTNWDTGDKKTMRAYAENIQAANPRPTASGTDCVAIGSASLGGASASGLGAVAIGTTSSAASTYAIAIGIDAAVSSGTYNSAIGTNSLGSGSRSVTGSGVMSLGGSYASGSDSFAAAVANNTSTYGAQGANSIAIGQLARASNTTSVAIGANSISTGGGSVAISANGTSWGCEATNLSSVAIGDGAQSSIRGKFAFASGSSAIGRGIMQSGKFILSLQTNSATPSTLNSYNYGASDATNQVVLPNNSAFAFTGTVVARRQASGGTESAAWKIEGLIRREGSAATTTLVASTVTAISNAPGWGMALSADTTSGALAVTATGAGATNIRWVANIDTSEVIYA